MTDAADDKSPQPSQPLAVGGGDRHDAHAAAEQRAAHVGGHAAAVAEEDREAALKKERRKEERKRLKRKEARRDAAAVAEVESEEVAPDVKKEAEAVPVSKAERRRLKRERKVEGTCMDSAIARVS